MGVAVAQNVVLSLIPRPCLLHPKVPMRGTRNLKIAPKDMSLLCESGALWPSLSQINSPFNIYICRRICIIMEGNDIKYFTFQSISSLGSVLLIRVRISEAIVTPGSENHV